MPLELVKRQATPTFHRRFVRTLLTIGATNLGVASFVFVLIATFGRRDAVVEELSDCADVIASQSGAVSVNLDANELGRDAEFSSVALVELFDDRDEVIGAWSPEESAPTWRPLCPAATAKFVDALGSDLTVRVTGRMSALVPFGTVHVVTFLALVALTSGLSLVMSRRLRMRYTDQLLDLVHTANAVSIKKDYSIRAVSRGDKEFRIFAETFNHMISQIELQEEQLREEVERARAARESKARFLATMSHEIRTPINGVIGVSELLMDTDLTLEQADYLRTINRSADGLLRIINDILDFSKIEAGQVDLDSQSFVLGDVLDGCLETVSTLVADKDVEITCQVGRNVPNGLVGDANRLRQVVLNLLGNALKFTERGEVSLRVEQEERGWLRFEVRDTGIGIPEDRIERLFKSFSQVDSETNRKYEGTGLGLVISKQIVQAMGGTMFVRTQSQVGSVFGFRLKMPVDEELSAASLHLGIHGLRVLVVETSRATGDSVARHLVPRNEVVVADDAVDALMRIEDAGPSPFHVLIVAQELVGAFAERRCGIPLAITCRPGRRVAPGSFRWNAPTVSLARPVRKDSLEWSLASLLDTPRRARKVQGALEPLAAHAPGSQPPACDLSTLRVLVAEDNSVNQMIVRRFLEKLGIDCALVGDGRAAVHAVANAEFDVVLMDVQMPEMDGVEAVRLIREAEPTGERVVIAALTANVLAEDREYYLGAGFDHHLAKPLRFETLRSFLEEFARSSEPLRSAS